MMMSLQNSNFILDKSIFLIILDKRAATCVITMSVNQVMCMKSHKDYYACLSKNKVKLRYIYIFEYTQRVAYIYLRPIEFYFSFWTSTFVTPFTNDLWVSTIADRLSDVIPYHHGGVCKRTASPKPDALSQCLVFVGNTINIASLPPRHSL